MLEPDENLGESDPCISNTGSTDVKVDSVDDDALPIHLSPKEQKKSKSLPENKRSKKEADYSMLEPDENLEESDPCTFNTGSTDVKVDSVDDDALPIHVAPKEQKKSKSLPENKRSKKCLRKCSSKKATNSSESVSEVEASQPSADSGVSGDKEGLGKKLARSAQKSSSNDKLEKEKMEREDIVAVERTEAEVPESDSDFIQLDTGIKTKAKKRTDSPVHENPEVKPNKKLSRTKKSKSSSEDKPNRIGEEIVTGQPEPMDTSQKQPRASTDGGMSSKNVKSSRKESTTTEVNDEQLGDMSFLISVNSRIALFVADASQEECELQPMTARERNDVYKVTHLYKLRARIGTKTENNLTTVRLSKQVGTRMPKPGRVDSLLSELSIAASKVAFKESPKNHEKRKYSAVTEGDDQTVAEDGADQAAPPKKKHSKLSRSKKQ